MTDYYDDMFNEDKEEYTSNESSLSMYLKEVRKYNLLSEEEVVALAKRIENGDEFAKEDLVNSNLRLCISIAKRYRNKGVEFEDLIQAGNLALYNAAGKFDYRQGNKFSTYASIAIENAIRREIGDNGFSISLPKKERTKYAIISAAKSNFEKDYGFEPTEYELAGKTGYTEDEIREALTLPKANVSINSYIDGEDGATYEDFIPDENAEVPGNVAFKSCQSADIAMAIGSLTDREQKVIKDYFYENKTLEQIGKDLHINREGVHITREKACRKMRTYLGADYDVA